MKNKVIIVLASRRDLAAQVLVERWAAHGACLMTPDDLSVAGWRCRVVDIYTCTAIVAGRPLASRDICGVLTRLPSVVEQDLGHIVPADRTYVAAEMTAFLLSWLTELTCPVLNRPIPPSLSGPHWRHEQWVHTAARLGIPVTTARRHAAFSALSAAMENPQPDGVTVTIVGQRHFGEVDQMLVKQARSLADAAGVDLLAVRFSCPKPGSAFVNANLWPDVLSDDVADGILEYLHGGSIRG